MRYGSVCSGIEAATVAWHPLGWQPAFFSEIEAFPRAVLAHHYPDVPCHGDFTTIGAEEYGSIDLLVGGTPCQSFSIAGLRKGLDDDRGNLALEFIRLAQRKRPRWLVWENVPGVLSSNKGRDFGTFLAALGEIGYGFAYRVLDAQYFGVAQRRRRVFVVGYLGDWRRAAAVLFERHSLSGHPAPRREARSAVAARAARSLAIRGRDGTPQYDPETETLIPTHGGGFDVAAFDWQSGGDMRGLDLKETAQLQRSQTPAIAFDHQQDVAFADLYNGAISDVAPTMGTPGSSVNASGPTLLFKRAVRRLTPRECERLQGFPDDYTLVPYRNKPMADGPRYKALGNSMAVPVMRWIGERIQMVENLKC